MNDLVELGYISKAFGLKGAVVVALFNEDSEILKPGTALFVKRGKEAPKILTVARAEADGRVLFEGIDDRTQAELLRGATVSIARSNLPDCEADECYLQDLLGISVYDTGEKNLGQVVGLSTNSAQDLAEVKTAAGHKAYIPLIAPILVEIDLEGRRLVIDPPDGLLDLAS